MSDLAAGFDGANYVRSMMGLDIAPFPSRVADILGRVWRGIYHIPKTSLAKAHWKPAMVEIVIQGGLATFDSGRLTELVVLCHDEAIRFEISPASSRHLRLQFYERSHAASGLGRFHPTMLDSLDAVRAVHAEPESDRRWTAK